VSFLGGLDGSGRARSEPVTGVGVAHDEERRTAPAGRLGVGTLACRRCDAPVALAASAMSPADALTCPFCDWRAPVRDFLSLATPTRPARVEIRVSLISAPRAPRR
jgi:hypothetical protein